MERNSLHGVPAGVGTERPNRGAAVPREVRISSHAGGVVMARAWGQLGPASPDVNLSQFVDQLVILCIGGYSNNVATQYGDKGAVRVALVVITGPNAGLEVPDLMVFNSRVVSRLKGAVGSILPAAVTYGEGRGSQQPIDLVEVTANPQAMQLIGAWDDAHPGRVDQLLTDCISEHQAVQYREQ